MSFDAEKEISDLKARVETIEGIVQRCPSGQHWDLHTQSCVPDAPIPPVEQALTLMGATSSTPDGANTAQAAIDGKTTTRFSSKGPGAFITIDLGGVQEVRSIRFTWFNQANESRRNVVGIDFSEQTWPNPPTGTPAVSHTNTSDVSTVEFATRKARAIIIRLMSTSNTGNWFSITDIKISGVQLVEPRAPPAPPTPSTPPPPPTQPTTPTTPTPAGTSDSWGFPHLYANKAGNRWEFGGNVKDPRFFDINQKNHAIKFISGSSGKNGWCTTSNLPQLRLGVLPISGLDWRKIPTYHFRKVAEKGFLNKRTDVSDGDWGDFEMTWAIRNWRPGSGSYESHIEIVIAGFRSSHVNFDKVGVDKAVTLPCQSMALHWNIYPPPGTNRCKFEKNVYHNKGYTVESSNPKNLKSLGFIDSIKGFVMKAVFFRVKDTKVLGGFATKLELWLSTDGLTGKKYRKVLEYLDNGRWGPTKTKGIGVKECFAPNDYPVMNMGKCNPHFRMDFAKSIEFSRMSIRTIDPSKPLIKSS